MTTIRTLRRGIEENQKQARGYIAQIIEALDQVPQEHMDSVALHLAQVLDSARAKVREIKGEAGRDIGHDTSIISTDRVALAERDQNGHNRVS